MYLRYISDLSTCGTFPLWELFRKILAITYCVAFHLMCILKPSCWPYRCRRVCFVGITSRWYWFITDNLNIGIHYFCSVLINDEVYTAVALLEMGCCLSMVRVPCRHCRYLCRFQGEMLARKAIILIKIRYLLRLVSLVHLNKGFVYSKSSELNNCRFPALNAGVTDVLACAPVKPTAQQWTPFEWL